MIKRRHVLHLTGYDAIGEDWARFLNRELGVFSRTWNVSSTASDLASRSVDGSPKWTMTTHAPNWQVESVYEPLLWDDIALADFAASPVQRAIKSSFVFLDLVKSGMLRQYFKSHWKFGVVSSYPYMMLGLFGIAAVLIACWAASATQLPGLMQAVVTAALGPVLFILLLRWLGLRWRVQHALAVGIFWWEYIHGHRADLDQRLDRFAERLIALARDMTLDEIVVSGYSMGTA